MVEYTLVLELGQSNASPIGDIQGWEDNHPEYAIRSPKIARERVRQFSAGSYRDDFTYAATFKGGPQIDLNGATINGTWQTVNLRGVAVDAVRVATFHNPSATLQTDTAYARSWPGTYSVVPNASQPNKGREFATNFLVQPGRTTGTNASITAESAQELTTGAAHGLVVNDIVVLKNGTNLGLAHNGPYRITDISGGSDKFKIVDWPSGAAVPTMTYGAGATVHKVNNTASPFLLTRKRTGSTHTYAPTGLGQTEGGRLVVDPPFTPAPEDNEEFTVDMRLQQAPSDANDPLVFDACLGGFVNHNPAMSVTGTKKYLSKAGGFDMLHQGAKPLRRGRAIKIDSQTQEVWPTHQPDADVPASYTATQSNNNVLTVSVAQEFVYQEKIRISYASGDGPTNLLAGDYYVQNVDSTTVAGTERLTLRTTPGGSDLTFTWASQQPIIERLDAYSLWFLSLTRDGATGTDDVLPSVSFASPDVGSDWLERDRFAGSIAGLRLRCTSGANVGQWKHGKHVDYDSTNDLCRVHFDGSWSATPTADDVFVIEPTPVGSEVRPFEKFCQLLPWAPWEGLAAGGLEAGPATVTIDNPSAGAAFKVTGLKAPVGSALKFYTSGTLPHGLIAGKTYYSVAIKTGLLNISDTYGGSALVSTGAAGEGTHSAEIVDNDLGYNPHPPGFNYPNQFSIPRRYMPFDGYVQGSFYNEETAVEGAGVSAGLQLAFDLHNSTGRRSLFVPLTFNDTTLGHREVHGDGSTNASIFGWSDLNQQLSWAPGEANGCFARLLDVLDGVKLALTEEGSTIKDVVVFFNQGEADAELEYLAGNYRQNLKKFKSAVRQALADRGLTVGSAARVKWLQNTIREKAPWTYASTVNASIEAEALTDAYSRSLVGSNLEVFSDQIALLSGTIDSKHYYGTQMDLLGQRAFTAFKSLERSGKSEVDVCNIALANLGEQARVTSIDPSDGSREADLCAQFFDLARDQLLEKHAWDFALRSVTLTKRSTSPRVDWKCAYDYPDDVISVLSVVRSDVDYNYKTMGNTGQQPYSVELDANGVRMLLTDEEDAMLLYVAKVTDSTQWSSLFIRALSWQLACHLAGPVLKGEEGMKMVQMCEAMAERVFRQATKHDSDHKRDVDVNDHVPTWQRHRSNRGYRF